MHIQQEMNLYEKLNILTDAAKYDVACTSSGVDRKGDGKHMGNCEAPGICHSFAADGRCISLLKILFTNECIYNCRYCVNRSSNDVIRTSFTPEEVCQLTMEFYRRNFIEGLFLSSGILHSPDYTMEQIYQTLFKLREQYHFRGYIHVKAIPGADSLLVEKTGFLADRMSVNLELPTADGLRKLAPNKSRQKILAPMRQVQEKMQENKYEVALYRHAPRFVPAGQSTQMICNDRFTGENHFPLCADAVAHGDIHAVLKCLHPYFPLEQFGGLLLRIRGRNNNQFRAAERLCPDTLRIMSVETYHNSDFPEAFSYFLAYSSSG